MNNELFDDEEILEFLLCHKKEIQIFHDLCAAKLFDGLTTELLKCHIQDLDEKHLKHLHEFTGIKEENYELCQAIKEILEERRKRKY